MSPNQTENAPDRTDVFAFADLCGPRDRADDRSQGGTEKPQHTLDENCQVANMRKWTSGIVNFLRKEDGPTAVEYAVMLALIVVVCIAAITTLGSNANKSFSSIGAKVAPGGGS